MNMVIENQYKLVQIKNQVVVYLMNPKSRRR